MKALLKKVLVMAALAMCFGFAVYIGGIYMPAVQAEDTTVSDGNVPTPTPTPVITTDAEEMQKATTATAKAADGTAVSVTVTAVTNPVQQEAEKMSQSTIDGGNGAVYFRDDYNVPIVTVDVAIEGAKPDGNVNVTLNHASIEAGATYIVNHKKSDGVWEQKVVKAVAAGTLDVELSSLSPVSFYKAREYVSGAAPAAPATTCATDFNKDLKGQIGGTPEGGVVYITKEDGRNSLDFEMVKRIVDRDQTLVMEYTYNGADYRIVIPGKAAVIDESVPIYGPLYLAAHYSSNAAVGGSSDSVTYTIAKGDTLSKIAATNGTTVAALVALNPQIKNINVIYVGQTINLQ